MTSNVQNWTYKSQAEIESLDDKSWRGLNGKHVSKNQMKFQTAEADQ